MAQELFVQQGFIVKLDLLHPNHVQQVLIILILVELVTQLVPPAQEVVTVQEQD